MLAFVPIQVNSTISRNVLLELWEGLIFWLALFSYSVYFLSEQSISHVSISFQHPAHHRPLKTLLFINDPGFSYCHLFNRYTFCHIFPLLHEPTWQIDQVF